MDSHILWENKLLTSCHVPIMTRPQGPKRLQAFLPALKVFFRTISYTDTQRPRETSVHTDISRGLSCIFNLFRRYDSQPIQAWKQMCRAGT